MFRAKHEGSSTRHPYLSPPPMFPVEQHTTITVLRAILCAMHRHNSTIGKRFGRLVVAGFEKDLARHPVRRFARCRCDCGSSVLVRQEDLRSGATRSCGCLRREWARPNKGQRTGLHHHPLYKIWGGMVQRCENPSRTGFKYYGGKGVKVCPEWRASSAAFIEWGEASGWRPGLTIDRIDPDGHYEPGNCQFITQSENTRRAHASIRANADVKVERKPFTRVRSGRRGRLATDL